MTKNLFGPFDLANPDPESLVKVWFTEKGRPDCPAFVPRKSLSRFQQDVFLLGATDSVALRPCPDEASERHMIEDYLESQKKKKS